MQVAPTRGGSRPAEAPAPEPKSEKNAEPARKEEAGKKTDSGDKGEAAGKSDARPGNALIGETAPANAATPLAPTKALPLQGFVGPVTAKDETLRTGGPRTAVGQIPTRHQPTAAKPGEDPPLPVPPEADTPALRESIELLGEEQRTLLGAPGKEEVPANREQAKAVDQELLVDSFSDEFKILGSTRPLVTREQFEQFGTAMRERHATPLANAAIDAAGASVWQQWVESGRAFDVRIAEQSGDWSAIDRQVTKQMGAIAASNGTLESVVQRRDFLLRNGPRQAAFQRRVEAQFQEFTVNRPQRYADQVQAALANDGAGAASRVLRDLIASPGNADPVTARLTLDLLTNRNGATASTTFDGIDILSSETGRIELPSTMQQMLDGNRGDINNVVYGNVSAAVENAARSPDTQGQDSPITRVAEILVNERFNASIENTVTDGNGATLSLEIARQFDKSGDATRADAIRDQTLRGVDGLTERTRVAAAEFVRHGSLLSEPMQELGPTLFPDLLAPPDPDDPQQAARVQEQQTIYDEQFLPEMFRLNPDLKRTLDADIDAIRALGQPVLRATDTLRRYAGDFDNESDVRGRLDAIVNDASVQSAVGSSDLAFDETLRMLNQQGIDPGVSARAPDLTAAPGEAEQEFSVGRELGAAVAYGALGMPSSYILLSQIKSGRRSDPSVVALLPEILFRSSVIRLTSGAIKIGDNPAVDLAFKSTLNAGIAVATTQFINRVVAPRVAPNAYASRNIFASRIIAGPAVNALTFANDALRDKGILPTPSIGADGHPQYDNWSDYLARKIPDFAAFEVGVAGPGIFSSAWGRGSRALYPQITGEVVSLRQAYRDGRLGDLFKTGFRGSWPSNRSTLAAIGFQYLASEMLRDRPPLPTDMPRPDHLLQDGPLGDAATVVGLGGTAMTLAYGSLAGGWIPGLGWGLVGASAAGTQVMGEIDRATTAAQYEPGTEALLRSAGYDRSAEALSNYNEQGQSVNAVIDALAARQGISNRQYRDKLERLASTDEGQKAVENFARALRSVGRNQDGRPIQSAEHDLVVTVPHLFYSKPQYSSPMTLEQFETHQEAYYSVERSPAPTTMKGLLAWAERYGFEDLV